MERTTKRVFCLLLALAMVLSVGVSAFAYGSTVTVYCQAPEEWETCYVYWWGSAESVVWPGAVMTQRSDGLWYYDVPTDATNLIFNNSYEYSLDLDMPTGDKVKYVYDSDSWETPYGGNTGSVTPGGSIGGNTGSVTPGGSIGGSTGSVTPGGSIGGSTDTPDTVTVYCQAPEEWETCYVYWWGCTESVVWPGAVMTQRSDGLWYYAVPADASNLVFHNLSEFSPDLDMPTGDKVKYVYDSDSWESPYGESAVAETDPVKIMEAAVLLRENEELPYDVFLSGKVTVVDDAYNAEYKNISVTIAVNGTRSFLKCYRLKGDGVDKVAVGDTITVTGRIKNYNGTLEFVNCTMTKRVSGGGTAIKPETDPVKILEAANKLKENEEMAYDVTLSGKVTVVDDAYNAEYKNISVTIAVSGTSSILKVYNMKGNGIDKIAVGDAITVTGRIKNYYGTIELVRGTMTSLTSGGGTVVQAPSDPKQIVAAAYALEKGASLPYRATLTGTITSVDTEYSPDYKNITVTITVAGCEDKPIQCYRLKGEGAETLKVGDVITVSGVLKRYYREADAEHPEPLDKIEFDAGCTLDKMNDGSLATPDETTPDVPEDAPGGNIGGSTDTPSTDTPGTDTPGTALPKDNNDSVLTLWAKVPSVWTTVNAYTWDAANTAQTGLWPGTTMTKDGEWYKIVITNKVVNVIINNGADQTPDLKVDSGKDLYVVVGDDKKATVYYADGTTGGDTTPCTHSYETTVISPTCTQPGYALHTCSLCGISYTGGEIPAKGHRFPDFVSDGNATCTKDGTETAVCLGCGKPSTRVETGSALGHSFTTYLYDYNAQCGKDGTETAKCDRCSLTDTRTAAGTALEHTFENGACTSCGAAETAGLVGDVTGDGKINIMDVVKLYAHVKGTPITDEYALACGDVSGDGKINIMDVVKLYAHVKGVSLVTKPSEEETVPTDKIKLEYAFLLPGKTERYELSIRIGDEVFLKSMTIQPGVSSVTIPLIGSGTVVYDLYVDGEYLRSETVIFESDK